ncbi:MAG: peptidylprolyl isomerase [Ignavibacteriae bacterium]|nr:peptidylprolyl isomerase [Ignavibacteriota bacterium]
MNKLAEKRYAILKTTQGDIKIKFYPEFAPFTVLNFIKLSEKGFYNKTVFHRVVPNFVIQGGDPLNTGWGGPDYTIRTEIAPVRYERGTVGMASDGKDTEGSQFFVTHTPFYHLDNRYTIFGEVVEGMDIVDRIYIGDVLETVVITDK